MKDENKKWGDRTEIFRTVKKSLPVTKELLSLRISDDTAKVFTAMRPVVVVAAAAAVVAHKRIIWHTEERRALFISRPRRG